LRGFCAGKISPCDFSTYICYTGRCKTNYVPTERRDFKPVENKTYTSFDFSKEASYDSVKQEALAFRQG